MPNKMFNCEIDDEEVEKMVKECFTPEEWENLTDILKIKYCNICRNYLSLSGDGSFMPLPEFMRKSKENQTNKTIDSNNKPKRSKSKTRKRSATDNLNELQPERNVSNVDYYKAEEPKEDRYVYCDNCGKEYLDFCSKCGMLVSLKDYPVAIGTEDRAKKTVPKDVLEIRPSQIHGFGVFTVRTLRQGVQMGPYEGKITRVGTTNGYSWKLRDGRLIDAGDEKNSNWMRYVNCARNAAEQNTVAFQYNGNLYYRTCKEIEKGEELLVCYGQSYATVLGIDTMMYFQPDEEEVNLTYFTCEYCFVGLSTSDYRDCHQRRCKFRPNRMVAYSNENFTCQYCDCSLTTMEYLKKHEQYCSQKRKGREKKESREERKYQCHYCEYKSTRKGHLKKHLMIIHEKQKWPKFQCEKCKYETVYKSNFLRHLKTHDRNLPLLYKCKYCLNKGFNTKKELDSHFFSHHQNLRHLITSKVHRCAFCNYETIIKTNLRNHVQARDPEETVATEKHLCNICDYSTKFKSNLNRHVLRHHPLNTNLLQMISNKIHNSHECTHRTTITTNLTRHIKTHNHCTK